MKMYLSVVIAVFLSIPQRIVAQNESSNLIITGQQYMTILSNYNTSFTDLRLKLAEHKGLLSPECSEDLIFTIEAISRLFEKELLRTNSEEQNEFTLPLLDSWGKFPAPGTLKGNTRVMGLLTECQNINYRPGTWERSVEGQYYRIFICQEGSVAITTSLDLCLPKSCENEDLTTFLGTITLDKVGNPICDIQSVNRDVMKPNFGSYFIGIFMLAILILCVCSSLFDYFYEEGYFQKVQDGSFALIRSFSLHRNVTELLSTETSNTVECRAFNNEWLQVVSRIHTHRTNFLNCIRFFSISWVICGHVFEFNTIYSSNPSDAMDYVHHSYLSNFAVNSFFGVDSFFLLAGLLVSYTWFKIYKTNIAIARSAKTWLMFYIHRFLRITPLYYIILLFFAFLLPLCYINMPVLLIQGNSVQNCQQNFWINMLYLQNFVNSDAMCFGVTWFLATDLQMFIFSPLVLLVFTYGIRWGALLTSALVLISSVATGILVGVLNLPPVFVVLGKQLLDRKIASEYRIWVYTDPLTRCPPYVIGILLGYMMQMKKIPKVHWVLNLILWTTSLIIMVVLVLCGHIWNREVETSLTTSILYNLFSRLIWSMALAWIVISCYNRQGGPIGAFMNWNLWTPLGRLSYAAYLLHFPLIELMFGAKLSQPVFRNGITLLFDTIIPFILFTFLLSLFVSAVFEVPFSKLESMFLPRRNLLRRKVAVQKPEDTTLEDNFTEEERTDKVYF